MNVEGSLIGSLLQWEDLHNNHFMVPGNINKLQIYGSSEWQEVK